MKIMLRLILFYLLKFLPSETYLIGFIQTKMKQKTQRVPQASVYLSLNSGRTICGSFLWSGRLLPRKQIKRSVNSYCSSINRSANSLYPFVLKRIFRSVAFFLLMNELPGVFFRRNTSSICSCWITAIDTKELKDDLEKSMNLLKRNCTSI